MRTASSSSFSSSICWFFTARISSNSAVSSRINSASSLLRFGNSIPLVFLGVGSITSKWDRDVAGKITMGFLDSFNGRGRQSSCERL